MAWRQWWELNQCFWTVFSLHWIFLVYAWNLVPLTLSWLKRARVKVWSGFFFFLHFLAPCLTHLFLAHWHWDGNLNSGAAGWTSGPLKNQTATLVLLLLCSNPPQPLYHPLVLNRPPSCWWSLWPCILRPSVQIKISFKCILRNHWHLWPDVCRRFRIKEMIRTALARSQDHFVFVSFLFYALLWCYRSVCSEHIEKYCRVSGVTLMTSPFIGSDCRRLTYKKETCKTVGFQHHTIRPVSWTS